MNINTKMYPRHFSVCSIKIYGRMLFRRCFYLLTKSDKPSTEWEILSIGETLAAEIFFVESVKNAIFNRLSSLSPQYLIKRLLFKNWRALQ